MSLQAMTKSLKRIAEVARKDGRYKVDAYHFVQAALVFAQHELGMGRPMPFGVEGDESEEPLEIPPDAHLTGQQLCEAIRQYASERYGLMAQLVLNDWGVTETGDFGEIVYNLIEIGEMTKSEHDRRSDFDDQYDFDEAFRQNYEITMADES